MRMLALYIMFCTMVLGGFSAAKYQGMTVAGSSGQPGTSSGSGSGGRGYGGSGGGSGFHK